MNELFDKGHRPFNRLQAVLDYAEEHNFYIQRAWKGYAEPGYGINDNKCVFLANWNRRKWKNPSKEDMIPERIANALEKMGYEIEWEGEWLICDCGKAFRCSPDSFFWTMYGHIGDGDYICGDCIKEDPESFLDDYIGDSDKVITFNIDLEDLGYVCMEWDENGSIESNEMGWNPGQDVDPYEIAECLEDIGITDYLFKTDSDSQFYSCWSTWVKRSEIGLSEEEDNWDVIYQAIEKFRVSIWLSIFLWYT